MSKFSIFDHVKNIWTFNKVGDIIPYENDKKYCTINRKNSKNMKMVICEVQNKCFYYKPYQDFKTFLRKNTDIMLKYFCEGNTIFLRIISENEDLLKQFKDDIQKYNEFEEVK